MRVSSCYTDSIVGKWKYLRGVWQDNHGGWLIAVAALTCLVIGLLWRLQLVPDIRISSGANRPILSQTIPPQNGILVAQVIAPNPTATQRGLILLFRPEDDLQQPPVFQQSFQLDESGMTTLLIVLPPGPYKAAAFLDINENGVLDFKDALPVEPVQYPNSKNQSVSEDRQEMSPIVLLGQEPLFCLFQF